MWCGAAVWTFAVAGVLAQDAMRFADEPARDLFLRSRASIVQTGSVRDLRSLILRGRIQSPANDGSTLNGRVEIKMLFPDYFLETDTYGADERLSGFAGKTLLTATRDHGALDVPPANLTTPLLQLARAHMTRLMLGAATYIPSGQELTFRTSGGMAQMVDPRRTAQSSAVIRTGDADPFSIDVSSEGFAARFAVDSVSRVPTQLVYQGSKQMATTMAFADRRAVGGLLMPYRITTTAGSRVLETLTFDEILVNPELSKNDFRR
jgi:hypothetical protein